MLLLEILTDAGVEVQGSQGNERNICCPFCVERDQNEDMRFRFGINIATGFAHCFNCEWGSRSVRRTAKELCRVFGLEFSLRKVVKYEGEEEVQLPSKTSVIHPVPLPVEFERFRWDKEDHIEIQALKYLKTRGVPRIQLIEHHVGFCASGEQGWRIVFPVLGRDGLTYGYVGRDFSGNAKLKYKNSEGNKMLHGAHRAGRVCVVVEGVMDELSVDRALTSSHPDYVAVARLGSAVTDIQLEQLAYYDTRIILPDWDKPGIKGAISLAEECEAAGLSCMVSVPPYLDGSDPGSHIATVLRTQVNAAVPWSKAVKRKMRVLREV